MPRVPTYDNLTVADRPLPGVRQDSIASPSLLSGQAENQERLARTANYLGEVFTDLALKGQDTQNADMLFRAEASLRSDYLDFETSARERRGQSAWGVTNEAKEWWDEKARKTMDGLENDAQRKLFMKTAASLRQQSLTTMSRHEADQRQVSLTESAQASITSAISLAAANANAWEPAAPPAEDGTPALGVVNPVTAARGDALKRVQVLAQINGWAPEVRAAKETEYLTSLHTQVIQNLADSNPKKARDYFDLHRAEINGASHDGISKVLKTGGIKVSAQSFADEVMAGGINEADALAAARKKFEGDEEAAVTTEIKTRFAERTAGRERMQRDAADEAYSIYAKTGRVSAIPAALWEKMDGKVQLALKKDAQTAAEGKLPKTDWDKYYELRQQAISDPAAFARRDLRAEFPHLGKSERESLIDLQTKKPAELREVQTLDTQINATLVPLGLSRADTAQATDAIRRAIDTEQRMAGKQLPPEARQKIIDRMLIEGEVIRGRWYLSDPNRRLYQVTPAERAQFKANIPERYTAQIVEALRATGRPVTDENIIDLYNQTKRAGRIK